MALVYTQSDLDNAKAALVSGATHVMIGERRIQYRSQDDILKLIGKISSYLDGTSLPVVSPKTIQATFKKGQTS